MKPKGRIISLLLAICLVAGLLPTAAFAAETDKTIQLGTNAIQKGDSVYYGICDSDMNGYLAGDAIQWQVLDAEKDNCGGGGMFLLSKYLLEDIQFEASGGTSVWQNSDARNWCKSFVGNSFAAKEQAEIKTVSKTDSDESLYGLNWGASELIDDQVFFLSAGEASDRLSPNNGANELKATYKKGNPGNWWLRSPYSPYAYVGVVPDVGDVSAKQVVDPHAVRPAFNLNLNSVLFSSAAVGGKSSGAVGAGSLQEIESKDISEWKLTLADSSRDTFTAKESASSATSKDEGYTDWSLEIEYDNAKTGSNEYVSALLCDDAGNALYYGNIAQSSESGIQEVKIPSGLSAGTYALNIFSEQLSGDYKTDYASSFQNIPLTVIETDPPLLSDGSATRSDETNATVKFTSDKAGTYYYAVIDSGAAVPADLTASGISGSCLEGENTINLTSLTAGKKRIYIVVKDAVGKESEMLKIEIPASAFAEEECVIQLGTNAITKDDSVYYGICAEDMNGYTQGEAIQWQVLGAEKDNTDNEGMFLLSKYLLKDIQFDAPAWINFWQNSDAQSWCKSFVTNSFAAGEQTGIKAVSKTDKAESLYNFSYEASELIDEQVFFLSAREASDYLSPNDRAEELKATYENGNSGYWWLRSPSSFDLNAGVVNSDGVVADDPVDDTHAARPAFNLDLKSVIFSSAAVGGKASGAVGAGSLQEIEIKDISEWKLTLADSSRDGFTAKESASSATSKNEGYADWSLNINYENAKTGTNEYVSALLCDDAGNALYYGNIAQSSESGRQEVKIPSGLSAGTYTLNIFSEQCNGDKKTDYASAFQEIALTIHTHIFDQEEVKPAALKTEATCTESAVYYKSCQCGEVSKNESETFTSGNPLRHDWKEPVWSWKPDYSSATATFTCSREESHQETPVVTIEKKEIASTCVVAGESYYEATTELDGRRYTDKAGKQELPLADHTFGQWQITKEATETATGEKTRVCSVCGYEEKDAIPMLSPGGSGGEDPSDGTDTTNGNGDPSAGNTSAKANAEDSATGDESNMLLFIILTALSAAGCAAVVIGGRRKKKR